MREYIENLLRQALKELDYPVPDGVQYVRPKVESHGDISVNVAMLLAGTLKKPPKEIALSITNNLKENSDLIERVEVAPPGFINIFIKQQYFQGRIKEIVNRETSYGRLSRNRDKKAIVEFVSANPTGPLTVGHGRNAVLGDVVANILNWSGYEKIDREYYFNNAGRQMRILGESVKLRYLELLGGKIEFTDEYYQGEYIGEIARKIFDRYGETLRDEPAEGIFKNEAENLIFREIKETCERLGIVFDTFYNEKSLYDNGMIEEVIGIFKRENLTYEKDGALWLKTSELGLEQDKVIVKQSGEPTYRLPDIAYHRDKFRRGYDLIVDILGADHHAAYPDVLAGIRALGYNAEIIRVLIHQFVTVVRNGEVVKMSTRKATYITLDELIDETGSDPVRYFFLMRSPQSHLNFDINLAKKQSDENPVYYLQYAYARIASILRFASTESKEFGWEYRENIKPDDIIGLLNENEELLLAKLLDRFPEIVELCSITLEPHHMCNYLTDLAAAFHKFYHNHRVVTENGNLSLARLTLCRAVRIVLGNGLSILGITSPENM